ncbi:activating transcription factor 7-interacting protein 1-like isoform X2 [Mya arenaria]|uniref:activating transcription factor 7-interacting protein 1-like isoform X2 n=1 Tax=Mya arenaria TaxID=6604 RepID=UPI0022E4D7D0|nr:activating transcription factor 7-interacting protein 1-like isoform X2 [Mya arenaria]
MDDIDEGIGSNDSSTGCVAMTNILQDLKHINGQTVLKDHNGGDICERDFEKNGTEIGGDDGGSVKHEMNGIVKEGEYSIENDDIKGIEDYVDNINENSEEKGMVMGKEKEKNDQDENDTEKEAEMKYNQSPPSNDSAAADLATNIEDDIEENDDSLTKSPENNGLTIEKSEQKLYTGDESKADIHELIGHSSGDCDQKKCSNDSSDEPSETKENLTDDKDNEDTELRKENECSPSKSNVSEADDGHKSPFVLNEGVRNSLKGLVAKVKSFEKLKDNSNIEMEKKSKIDEVDNADLITESQPTLETVSQDSNAENEDDLLKDDEEGISMEIASDDDLLLVLSPDEKNSSKEDRQSDNVETKNTLEEENNQTSQEIDQKVQSGDDVNDVINISDSAIVDTLESDVKKNENINKIGGDKNVTSAETSEVLKNNENKMEEEMETDETENVKEFDHGTEEMAIDHEQTNCTQENGLNQENEDSLDDVQIIEDDPDTTDQTKTTFEKPEDDKSKEIQEVTSDMEKEISKNHAVSTENNEEQRSGIENNKVQLQEEADDDIIFEGESKERVLESKITTQASIDKDSNIEEKPNETCDKVVEDSVGKEIDTKTNEGAIPEIKSEKDNVSNNVEEDDEDDDVIFEKEVKPDTSHKSFSISSDKSSQECDNSSQTTEKESKGVVNNHKKDTLESDTMCNNSKDSNDRKRPLSFPEQTEHSPKRSKLDNSPKKKRFDLNGLINKLGSRAEPVEVVDSDNEETDTAPEMDECDKEKPKDKYITISEKELDALVREKVKVYMTSRQDVLVTKLSAKVKELQTNNDLWKRQVKDLQIKVNDVTILQQKQEKRKAATAAHRNITTRNVAVQVEDGKTSSGRALKPTSLPANTTYIQIQQAPPGSAPGTGTIRLPIPSSMAKQGTTLVPQQMVVSGNINTPNVKTLLDTTRIQRTVGSMPLTTTSTAATPLIVQYPPGFIPTSSGGQTFVTIPTQSLTPSQPQTHVLNNVSPSQQPQKPSPAKMSPSSKVIDLTDDDDISKTRLMSVPKSNSLTVPVNNTGVRQVLTPQVSMGTQFLSQGLGSPPTYQLVMTSPPGTRPGMVTAAPAIGSNQLVTFQASPVTPGTVMARAAASATPMVIQAPQPKPEPKVHPAPFPMLPANQPTAGFKRAPPKPILRISRGNQGIVLSWNMAMMPDMAIIASYQLWAYQETSAAPAPTLWKKVGEVKALPLPMACTLTQFQVGNKYHFAVRALDVHDRVGNFSDPGSIHLTAVVSVTK